MIYLDGIGLSFLIDEVKNKILNFKLTKIYQYDRSSFSFFFGKINLLFQIKDNSTIFYIKDEKDLNTDFQSRFFLSLKKFILNSILTDIRQEGFDRIVYFDFEKLNQFGDIEKYTFIMEIMGKSSNVFLTSKNKILTALYFSGIDQGNRTILTGADYSLPFSEKKISPLYVEKESFPFSSDELLNKVEGVGKVFSKQCSSDFNVFKKYISEYSPIMYEKKSNEKIQKILTYNDFDDFSESSFLFFRFNTINQGLNEYFKSTVTSNVINEKKKALLKYIDSQIRKYEKIQKNIKIDLNKNKNFETYKNIGDILAANMHTVKYGMEKITLFDFYNNTDITVKLDPLLSPNDNLNSFYNRYNKGKRTETALNERLSNVKSEIEYFEQIRVFIEKETDFIGIEEIESELNPGKNNKTKIKLNKPKKRELLSFIHNGFKILVGRNNKENEEISFSKGNLNDIWLHVKDIPGSHVLILRENKDISDDVLYYAAHLAARYSKGNKGDRVNVDYCEKKYVKKIKNSKPGNVTYSNFSSLNITI